MRAFKRVISMKIELIEVIARLHKQCANEDKNLVKNISKCYPFLQLGYGPWRSWRTEPFRVCCT